jgi:hypothetical protein
MFTIVGIQKEVFLVLPELASSRLYIEVGVDIPYIIHASRSHYHLPTWGSGHCKHGMYESPLGLRVMMTSLVFYVILYFNELIDSFL